MISILIPTYNYAVSPLVSTLNEELKSLDLIWEILVYEDGSDQYLEDNSQLEAVPGVRYINQKENKGRTAARTFLAQAAQFDQLIFLDADVLPVNSNFVATYAQHSASVVFGGIAYSKDPPASDQILRWTYGHERESVSIEKRNKAPYQTINSGCFKIDKNLFLKVNEQMQRKRYGMDIYFKELLQKEQADVLHIDNPVYHLGLESNEAFLRKALEAVKTTFELEQEGKLSSNLRPLQRSYRKLRRFGGTGLFSWAVGLMKGKMERNFKSASPNLFWFDLYRLRYYIQLKKQRGA